MKYNSYIKPFRTLYARITMWIMLTVLVVFVIITYLVTYFGAKGVLLGSTENAKSRMEITNQRINTVMHAVEVAVYNTIPEVRLVALLQSAFDASQAPQVVPTCGY